MGDASCFASALQFGRESEEWNEKGVACVVLPSLMVIKKAVDEKHKAQSSDSNTKGNATHQTESTVSVSLLRMLSRTRLPSSVMLLPEQTQCMKKEGWKETRCTRFRGNHSGKEQ